MNSIHRFELWGETHHPKWMDVIRIGLGVFLCYSSIHYFSHMSELQSSILNHKSFNAFNQYMFYLSMGFVFLAAGILMVLGVLTRFACIVAIPFLVAGLIFTPHGDLWLTSIAMLFLIYFLAAGNGPVSVHLPTDEEQR